MTNPGLTNGQPVKMRYFRTSQGPSPTGATVQNYQEAKPFPLVSVISHVFASVTGCRELSEEIFLGKFRTTKNRKAFKLYYAMRLCEL